MTLQKSQSVLIVGNATQDSVYMVPHLPADDEVCAVSRNIKCLGGRGVVPALVGAALGLNVELCTVIGSDLMLEFTEFLHARGVGTSAVKWDTAGTSTTQYVAFIEEGVGRSVAVAHAARLNWTPTQAQRDIAADVSTIYFSTNDPAFNLSLLSEVRAPEQVVIHNLGVRFEDHPGYLDAMLSRSTILVGNRVEMARLEQATSSRPETLLAASKSLQAIVVTRGRQGLVAFERGEGQPIAIESSPVPQVVSPVGAGDALAAGVVAGVSAGMPVSEALSIGAELGALAVQSELSYPQLSRVSEFANKIPRSCGST